MTITRRSLFAALAAPLLPWGKVFASPRVFVDRVFQNEVLHLRGNEVFIRCRVLGCEIFLDQTWDLSRLDQTIVEGCYIHGPDSPFPIMRIPDDA